MTQWKHLIITFIIGLCCISNPTAAQFMSNDPVSAQEHIQNGNVQGFNRYAYGNNNPYKFTDPDGRNPKSFGRAAKALTKPLRPSGGDTLDLAIELMDAGYSSEDAMSAAKQSSSKKHGGKTFQTYTKSDPQTGKTYSGKTSGTGTPLQNVARRDANHHVDSGPAVLDKSSTNGCVKGKRGLRVNDYKLSYFVTYLVSLVKI